AEDGIRDFHVTGVQTCALPIYQLLSARLWRRGDRRTAHLSRRRKGVPVTRPGGTWQNWARSAQVKPASVERPRTPEGVQRAVHADRKSVVQGKRVDRGGQWQQR